MSAPRPSGVEPDTDFGGALPRSQGDGRLNVELRLAGMVAAVWLATVAHGAAWARITVLHAEPLGPLPWHLLVAPQALALLAVLALLMAALPAARWPRAPGTGSPPSPWPLLLLGFPALLLAGALVLRDRRARRHPPDPRSTQGAFLQLLRLPHTLALHVLVWGGAAFGVDALVLGTVLGWPHEPTIALTLLWLALLAPMAALINVRTRAMVRPELLSAPQIPRPLSASMASLRLRLAVNSAAAALGAIAAPLAAGDLWAFAHDRAELEARARASVDAVAPRIRSGDLAGLGAWLSEHPNVSVRMRGATYGAPMSLGPLPDGAHDLDQDGQIDLWTRRLEGALVYVRLPPAHGLPPHLLGLGGGLCVLLTLAGIVVLAGEVRRDVSRATEQVRAVAEGTSPPPIPGDSFSTRELQQLVFSVERLINRITETNLARYVAIEKAKEADRLKSQFLANMSHDLRSPLNAILGFSELLLTGIDGTVDSESEELLRMIHDNGRRLLAEIDDVLDTAKIEAGKMLLTPEPTPPVTILSRAVHGAKKRMGTPVEIRTQTAPGLPPVHVDAHRAVQAVENVLRFAASQLDEEQALGITMRPCHLETGRHVALRIHTPVPPATAAQLRRARAGFTRIPGHVGLGLGLPLAASILELHGGRLDIEDMGDGMTFALYLPAPEATRPLVFGPTPLPNTPPTHE